MHGAWNVKSKVMTTKVDENRQFFRSEKSKINAKRV